MTCLFDKEKDCPLGTLIAPVNMAGFCNACTNRKQLPKMMENMKVMKAGLIISLLRMFPKDEEQAKQEYQKLMKRVEEW